MRARALALVAVVLVLLGLSAAPASATSYGYNSKSSKGVIYTRHCLTYSSSSCALVSVAAGHAFPRNTVYAMPGYGWKMCDVADGNPCIYGSGYVKVDTIGLKFTTWYKS